MQGGLGRGSLFNTPQVGLGGLGRGLGGGGLGGTGGGLFATKPGGLFSGGATQSTGGGLFGQQSMGQQTPAAQTGGGLFGAGNTGGGLFQTPQGGGLNQQKSFGGGSIFGNSPSLGGVSTGGLGGGGLLGGGGGGLFSQPQATPATGGLFSRQQSTVSGLGGTTGGGLFGNKGLGGLSTGLGGGLGGGLGTGMSVKFEPMPGTDTISKNGVNHSVATKLYCISAMKQYETQSLEEIRISDYQAGRKGSSGGGGLGTGLSLGGGLMGAQAGGLGGLGGGSIFGQNKPLVGGLGGGGGGLFGQSSQQPTLGGLGTITSTGGGLFSQQQQQVGGGGGLFNNTNTLGGLGNTAGGGMFNQVSQAGGLGGLGTTGLGGGGLFSRGGATGLGTSLQSSQAGSLFNKPLGTMSTLGGGLSLGMGQTGLGGGGLSLGGGIGGNTNFGNGLGGGLGTGLGMGGQYGLGAGNLNRGGLGMGYGTGLGVGMGTLGGVQNTSMGQSSLQSVSLQQQQAHLNQQLENLANSPFGDSPLFRSALSDAAKRKSKEGSTPVLSKATPTHSPHYKVNMRPSPRLKPKSLNSPMRHQQKLQLFDGLDDSNASSMAGGSGETFVPRSIKTLRMKPKPSKPLLESTPPPLPDTPVVEATPFSSRTAAFRPTPTISTLHQQDVSMSSPQTSLLATPLEKPVPIRPQTTPTTSAIATPLSVGASPTDTSTPAKGISPAGSRSDTGSLTRSPLRPRRCAVTLPLGYHTIPPLDELDSIATGSTCLVQNFTIGRQSYGEIHFPGLTDVYGMNLEQIVTIDSKEVVVYPDDRKKPLEGEGLNKKAVVSLEGNWPVDKSTREPIKDPDRIEKMGYVNKLERMTDKIGATFLGYDPNSGVCRFEVSHFSKYKLVADDESDDENGQDVGGVKKLKTQEGSKQPTTATAVTVQPVRPVLAPRQPTTTVMRTDQDEDMSDDDGFEDAMGVADSYKPHPLPMSQQLAATMGVRTHRVQVMKASFFGQEEPPKRSQTPPLQLGRQGLLRGPQRITPLIPQTTPLAQRTVNVNHTPPASVLQAQSSVLLANHGLQTLIPYKDSIVKGREHHIADLGLFMGKSFRVGWGPHWSLSHSGVQLSRSQVHSGSMFGGFGRPVSASSGLPVRAVVERVAVTEGSQDTSAYYTKFLEVQLSHTQFSANPTQATPTSGSRLLHALTDLVQATPTDSQAAEQLKRALELAVALWGDLPGDCDPDPESYEVAVARKRNVYKWLKSTNSEATSRDSDAENYLKTLFSLVAGQQLSEACHLAHEKGDYRLALLLSQATQNTIVNRVYIRKQLEEWKRHGTDRHIDPERLKLYVLLSGELVWELSMDRRRDTSEVARVVKVCKDLDWKRALALHLCYVVAPSSSVSSAVSSYFNSFQGDDPNAACPQPPYLESGHTHCNMPLPSDTCFHLLQLYCQQDHSLEQTLDPSSSVPHHLDYGISWLLWSVFTALGYTHMESIRQAQLHTSFSTQLEREGVWQWAVLPLQHISDPPHMENAIRELLARNCSSSEELSEQEVFVIEQLHVAREWVFAAKALRAHYENNYELEAWHLLEAGQWNDSHTVIVQQLAADAIINDVSEDLLQMLKVLSDSNRYSCIANWDTGGSVYLDFLSIGDQLISKSEELAEGSGQLLDELILGLNTLADRIGQLPCSTPKETLCQAEMAKKTATYTKLVLSLKYPEDSGQLYAELSRTLSRLPLPSDYALVEYRHLIQPCLNQLAKCY